MKLKAITGINLGGNNIVAPGEVFSIKDDEEANRFLDLGCVEFIAEDEKPEDKPEEKAEEKAVSKTSPKKGTK